ncbi:MAG: MerR family transcriptional regulator [Actinobacteria bacterium]|nr:MerR family transcriptional regulator [Actinomycetota bacterium]
MGTYTIGEVAERSGFTASALRYYEGIGLVTPPTRTDAGYRLYDDRSLARLSFIARAKQLGCSLEQITDLVEIWDGGRCGPVQERFHRLVTDKISDARRQVAELTALTADLQAAAAQLSGPPVDGPCGPDCACVTDGADDPASTAVAITLTAKPDAPIACTLGAVDLPGRLEEWRAMLAKATARTRTADGVRIRFNRTLDIATLAQLVEGEQEYCVFYTFAIVVTPEEIALDVHAPAGAEAMVEELFGWEAV